MHGAKTVAVNLLLSSKVWLGKFRVPPEIVAEVFSENALPKPSPEVVAAVFQGKEQPNESTPRTKEDIIGFSDPEDSESDAESIDVQPNMKLLPATLEGLLKHFHELYTEFRRQGKHEHRNELVFLLDELLLQQGIDREECTILNNILAKSLGSGRADEDFLDTVLEFEELVDVYLLKEFLKKEPIRIKIEEHWKVQLLSPNLSNID